MSSRCSTSAPERQPRPSARRPARRPHADPTGPLTHSPTSQPNEPAGGATPTTLSGAITLDAVGFAYPARPEVPVLRGVTFSIPAGWATAFVGGSGSGKTTVLQLLQKFYSPTSGRVRNREQEGGDAGRGHQAVGW